MSDWRVPVKMREPISVITDKQAPAADIRIYQWTGGIPVVGGWSVRDLIGYGKVMKIKAFHIQINNGGGVHTASQLMFWKLERNAPVIFLELIFHVAAGATALVDGYVGGDTALVDDNCWTYALPDIVLTGDYWFGFYPNAAGTGELSMLYEVYDE